jgi:ribokinase
MFDVIGLGASACDSLGIVPYYPALDERLRMLEVHRQGGGEAATALVTLSRLGIRTSFVGKIGDDEMGRFIVNEFKKENVDTSHIVVEKGGSSIFAFSIVDKETGKRTILWHKRLNPLNPDEMDEEFMLSARILHVDQHEPEAALVAAGWFKAAGKMVVLDIDTIDSRLQKLVRSADVVIGSEVFAKNFASGDDYFEAAENVSSFGPETIVFTLGEKGCLCRSKGDAFMQPAFEVDVVDTTGSGDVFHGAFIYGILQNWDLRKIAEFSNAVAAMKCRRIGGRAGIPTRKEVDKFLENAKPKL